MSGLAFTTVQSSASSLAETPPSLLCQAVVVIPARNEEVDLPRTLEALRIQVDLDGSRLEMDRYELIVLLNNCTDRSAQVAWNYRQSHPEFNLHILECTLPADEAHVGTARRMLMDLACARLERNLERRPEMTCAILSTDADTVVAPDWIAQNLFAIDSGAEVVGGVIHLFPSELEFLDEGTRLAYTRDRELQQLVAELESILDPDPADPWPRHLEHFGASLACTCNIYRLSGGVPPVKPLEDVAFVDALRKVDAKIRHAPDVLIFTSARLDGRAEIGLSGQLRHWRRETEQGLAHLVDSAEWLQHRFTALAKLRRMNESRKPPATHLYPAEWRDRLVQLHAARLPTARFLELLDCDLLIEETFNVSGRALRYAEITDVSARITALIRYLRSAPAHQAGNADAGDGEPASTLVAQSKNHVPRHRAKGSPELVP